MHLLCSLSFFVVHFDIYITVSYLPGVINVTADHLSRGNRSHTLEVTLVQHPTVIPPLLLADFSSHT